MARHVALLRGVNLGPRRRVPMAGLRALLEELGYDDVRTLLQSGNVGLGSGKSATAVREELEAAIADRFGVETDVVLRTRKDTGRGRDVRGPAIDGGRRRTDPSHGR